MPAATNSRAAGELSRGSTETVSSRFGSVCAPMNQSQPCVEVPSSSVWLHDPGPVPPLRKIRPASLRFQALRLRVLQRYCLISPTMELDLDEYFSVADRSLARLLEFESLVISNVRNALETRSRRARMMMTRSSRRSPSHIPIV